MSNEVLPLAWKKPCDFRSTFYGVAVHHARDLVCVIDEGAHCLRIFKAETGKLLASPKIPLSYQNVINLEIDEFSDSVILRHLRHREHACFSFSYTPDFSHDFNIVTEIRGFGYLFDFGDRPLHTCGYTTGMCSIDRRRLYFANISFTREVMDLRQFFEDANGNVLLKSEITLKPPHFTPGSLCFDNLGRVLVSEYYRNEIRVFSISGACLGVFKTSVSIDSLAFDFRRGRAIFTSNFYGLYAIEGNALLPDHLRTTVRGYDFGSRHDRAAMHTLVMLRHCCRETPLFHVPNELLGLIFEFIAGV